jgi:monovalent cation:H+ antiporter, CPA1 family
MTLYTIFSIIILLTALVAYVNHLYIKLQSTIAIMIASSVLALCLIISGRLQLISFNEAMLAPIRDLDFHTLLMKGMLSFLLFAGAMSVNVHELRRYKWEVVTLASVSTITSCFLIGGLFYALLNAIQLPISFLHCLLFGALISPTDPIAVLATFKKLKAPKNLHAIVAGESLFNDGVGVVLFLTIYHLIYAGDVTTGETFVLFIQQTFGGIAYGAALGMLCRHLLRPVHDHNVKILLTLALVTAAYLLAFSLDISGPLAMVMAGLIIGHHSKKREYAHPKLYEFWEIIDELLNAVLFFLIGVELVMVHISLREFAAALLAIPLVLIIRGITVSLPMQCFKRRKQYAPYINSLLTWGGLRGGLAIALAVSIPKGPASDLILSMTFAVVIFAIVVQGLSTAKLVNMSKQASASEKASNVVNIKRH